MQPHMQTVRPDVAIQHLSIRHIGQSEAGRKVEMAHYKKLLNNNNMVQHEGESYLLTGSEVGLFQCITVEYKNNNMQEIAI